MDLTSSPRKGAELEFESNSQLNPKPNPETKGWDTKAQCLEGLQSCFFLTSKALN